ncbi:hypothetical protein HDU92_002003 [Lobulomyces angularis]|nr:hypothetical protein HDU92_002003 [Lobulomyces angularis]
MRYMELVNYKCEKIVNCQQFANYHSEILHINYIVNVQEHFIQKVKTFYTELTVKRWETPKGLTKEERKEWMKTGRAIN